MGDRSKNEIRIPVYIKKKNNTLSKNYKLLQLLKGSQTHILRFRNSNDLFTIINILNGFGI